MKLQAVAIKHTELAMYNLHYLFEAHANKSSLHFTMPVKHYNVNPIQLLKDFRS